MTDAGVEKSSRARRLLKWAALLLVGVVLFLAVLGLRGRAISGRTYDLDVRLLAELPDSVDVREGRRLAVIHGCTDCHGADLGGEILIDAPPFLVVSPNLTSGAGGVVGAYRSPGDWDRAIRYRIAPDGRGLLPMMPSENYHRLSDGDLARIVAAVAAAPPVDNELPPTRLRPLGLVIAGAGVLHPDETATQAPGGPTPPAGPTAAYGAYLAAVTCAECHGDALAGGPTPGGGPEAPGLAATGRWSFEAFAEAMRRGLAPDGRVLAEEMPWRAYQRMTDTELAALHAHLQTLPAQDP